MGRPIKTTQATAEDLSAATTLYKAFAFVDSKLANDGIEASGILYNSVTTSGTAVIGVVGELSFSAGDAVSAGDPLTVTTSGWLITATAGTGLVGKAKADVSSGGTGVGLFNFSVTTSM